MTVEGHKKMTYLEIQRRNVLKILVEELKEGFPEGMSFELNLKTG